MNGLHTEKLLRHFYIFASLCVTSQISFGQESYPKHCSSVCLEYSKSYSAQNSEPYQDYCAINWGQIKNLSVDSRKSDASAFARDVASGRGTLRDKALHCLYSGVESGNVPNGSRVGVANSVKPNVDNRSTDQSQQNQSTQQQSQQAQQQAQQTQPTGPKENCEALFTAERRQKLPGPQYAQEYTDCLGRILARSKAQTAAPVVATTTQDAQQQAQQKTHDPAAKAHECIAIDNAGSGNFGAFKNICGYKVNFLTCNYKPRVIQGGFNWSADFDCEQQKFGLHTPDGGRSVAAHNRNTEKVYWFACKAPASPVGLTFVSGQGLSGRCN